MESEKIQKYHQITENLNYIPISISSLLQMTKPEASFTKEEKEYLRCLFPTAVQQDEQMRQRKRKFKQIFRYQYTLPSRRLEGSGARKLHLSSTSSNKTSSRKIQNIYSSPRSREKKSPESIKSWNKLNLEESKFKFKSINILSATRLSKLLDDTLPLPDQQMCAKGDI
eukprot:snap_masked-scaffold_8-processed-gene-1.30-mRNA-1 protein AED:1.00 eAED:1.00 QI:0/-1/0/0/-1/1/1/0/168